MFFAPSLRSHWLMKAGWIKQRVSTWAEMKYSLPKYISTTLSLLTGQNTKLLQPTRWKLRAFGNPSDALTLILHFSIVCFIKHGGKRKRKNLMAIDLDTSVTKMQSSLCNFFLLEHKQRLQSKNRLLKTNCSLNCLLLFGNVLSKLQV